MRTIPGQQKMHPVHCCNRNMRGIGESLLRQSQRFLQSTRQINDLVGQVQKRQALQSGHALASGFGIARRGLIQNELLDVDVESRAAFLPPLSSDLLMTRANQVPARPGGKIAWDGRFQVERRVHS